MVVLAQDFVSTLPPFVLHLLALIAVPFLLFRLSWAPRIVSALLALLWIPLALSNDLFFLEAFLFVALGVIAGQLEFGRRAGWRPIVGGLLIAYAIVIVPLVPPLASISAELPGTKFPIIIFTVGALLFLKLPDRQQRQKTEPEWKKRLKGSISPLLFLTPLLWCLFGGRVAGTTERWRDPGLVVALLACVAAMVPPPERKPFGGVKHHLHEESWVEWCYRWHRKFGIVLLGLLSAAFFLFLWGRNYGIPFQLAISAGLLSVAGAALWLAMPVWFLPPFRALAWRSANLIRRLREGSSQVVSRVGPVLVLALVAGVAWAAWKLAKEPNSSIETSLLLIAAVLLLLGTVYAIYRARRSMAILLALVSLAGLAWAGWKARVTLGASTPILAAAAAPLILGAVYAMYRARRSIVVFDFMNYSGTTELSECGTGLASRLRNELARISDLYGTMEEILPSPRAQVIPLDIEIQDSLESLSDVVGPDASLTSKIGVPIELLIRMLGRLVNGPHLTGGLHRQGQDYVLVADLGGGRITGTWQVCSRDLPKEDRDGPPSQMVYLMVERLAYMIVTDIGHVGSRRWEAVFHFTKGLQAYRKTQGALEGRNVGLRHAEQEFIRALSKDHGFVQCHYNLGVVYEDLKEYASAEAAFRHILKDHPDWSEAYYALAKLHSRTADDANDDNRERARRLAYTFSLRAIECWSGDTRAWNLYGHLRFSELLERWKDAVEICEEIEEPVRAFEVAVALEWRSLCRAAVRGSDRSLEKQRRLALICINNLAIARLRCGTSSFRASRGASREALLLSRNHARNHLVLGECFLREGLCEESLSASYRSFGDGLSPDWDLERWAYMTTAHHLCDHQEETRRASARSLDFLVPSESIVLASGEDLAHQRGRYKAQLRGCRRALDEKIKQKSPDNEKALQLVGALEVLADGKGTPSLSGEEQGWFDVQVQIFNAWRCLDERPSEAREMLEKAIEALSKRGELTYQVRRQGLHSLLAKAYLSEGNRDNDTGALLKALEHAQNSVSEEPESAVRRWILAEVFSSLGDVRQAQSQMKTALLLGGGLELLDKEMTVHSVGEESHRLAEIAGGETRLKILREAHHDLSRILLLLESRKGSNPKAHAAAHFWVGRCQAELGRLEDATINLEIARVMGCRPVEAALHLADLHCRKGADGQAEKVLQFALQRVERQEKQVQGNGATPSEKISPQLESRLRLAWALFSVEARHDLKTAREQAITAEPLIPQGDPDLSSLHNECLGWICLREGKLAESRDLLEKAARLRVSSGVNRRLAYVRERLSQDEPFRHVENVAHARRLNADEFIGRGIFDLGIPPVRYEMTTAMDHPN